LTGSAAATIHLDTPSPGASSGLPAGSGEQPSNTCATAPWCGLLGLASGGGCLATPVTRNAGALLPHRFTLTTARVAVCFLWHFPASRPGLPLAITLLCEVRTFLDSLLHEHEPRPPGQLVRANTVLVGECAGQQTPHQHIHASHSGHPYRLQVRREGSAVDANERLD